MLSGLDVARLTLNFCFAACNHLATCLAVAVKIAICFCPVPFLLAICCLSGCTVASGIVGVVIVIIGVCNRSRELVNVHV